MAIGCAGRLTSIGATSIELSAINAAYDAAPVAACIHYFLPT